MFGGTIAHGLLLLSLLPRLRPASLRDGVVVRMGINYGFDRIRFIQPVRSGSRIRGAFTPLVIERRPSGRLRETVDAAIELNGADKPAMTARWLTEFVL
jgi:acyl dehydratase